jgi:hypothetical protein
LEKAATHTSSTSAFCSEGKFAISEVVEAVIPGGKCLRKLETL